MANMNERFKIKVGIKIDEKAAYNEIKSKLKQIEKMLEKTGKITPFNQANIKKYNKELLKTKTRLKSVNSNMDKTGKKSKKAFDDTTKSVKKTNKGVTSYLSNIGSMIGAFAKFKVIMLVFENVQRAIVSLFKSTVDIEKKMAEFSIVSGVTGQKLESVNIQINTMVANLGALKTEVTDAATEFARAGFSMSSSMELAKNAIIGARVGFSDMDTVAVNLVATLKGFRLEADESSNVINDMFVASKTAAITFDGLGEAIKRSASAMNVAGASFEETISIISGANEAVQDASKVGSALKTISSRLRGVDAASNLPKLSSQMRDFGVEIEKSSGGFRNVYDILGDLSKRFQESSNEFQKQAVAESLAGKRRANVLLSLLNNWEKVEEVRTKALESSDEAEKAQQRLLETSSGQIEKMTGNWQIFADNVVNSDAIYKSLSFINNTLESINSELELSKKLSEDEGFALSGILEGSVQKQTGYGASLSQVLFGKTEKELRSEYGELIEDIGSMTLNELRSMKDEVSPLAEEYKSLTNSIKDNQEILSELKTRRGGFYVEEIEATSEAIKTQKQNLKELIIEMGKQGIVGDDVSEVLETIIDNMETLNEKNSETSDTMEESRTVAEKYYDDLKNLNSDTTQTMIKNWDNLSEAQQQNLINVAKVAVREKKKEIEERINNIKAIKAELTSLLNYQKVMDDELSKRLLPGFGMSGEKDAVETLKSAGRQSILEAQMSIDLALQELGASKNTLDDLLTRDDKKDGKQLAEPLSELEMAIKKLQHEIKLLDNELEINEGNYDEQVRITNKLIAKKNEEISKMEELKNIQEEEYKALKKNSAERQKAIEDYRETSETISDLENDVKGYRDSLVDLSKAQKETLEKSTSESVSNMRDEYSDMFDELRKGYQDEADAFEKSQEKKIRAVEKTIDRLRDKYDKEDFIDEEEEIQDKIADLEEERLSWEIATGLEGKKQRKRLDEEIIANKDMLSELQQERERNLTIEGLEDRKESYEEETRVYREELDERLKKLQRFEDDTMDKLDNFKDDWKSFGDGLGSAFEDGLLPSLETINKELAKTIAQYNEVTGADIQMPSTDRDERPSGGGGGGSNTVKVTQTRYVDPQGNVKTGYIRNGKTTSETGGDIPIGSVVETAGGNYQKTASGSRKVDFIDIDDYVKYHDGGVVGGQSFKNENILDYMGDLKSNEVPIVAEIGETVMTESDMGKIANSGGTTANFDSLIKIMQPQIGGNYNDISDFSKKLATETNDQLAKLGIVNIGRN